MTATIKKGLKLQKCFVAELARNTRLESEGLQVITSLANVSQRVPALLQPHDEDSQSEVMGVLKYSKNTQELLLQKHYLALEKSRAFLNEILRDYHDLLRHLRSLTTECVTLVDDAFTESESGSNEINAIAYPIKLQEWMETVLAMVEHELLRKKRLVADIEYSDTARLCAIVKQWSASGAMGNIDTDFVQTGVQLPNAISLSTSASSKDRTNKSKKKKK